MIMLLQIGMMMRSGITSCHQILKRPSIALGLTEINWPMVMNLQLWMRQGPLFIETSYPLNTLTKNIIFCTLKKYFTFSSIMNNCTLTKAFINILTKLYSLISQQNMLVTFCQALQLNNGLSMNFLACQFFRLATYMSDHPMVSPSKHVQLSSIHIPSTNTHVKCLSFLVSSTYISKWFEWLDSYQMAIWIVLF